MWPVKRVIAGPFVKLIEGARFETQSMPLPEMVQMVIELSTLKRITRQKKKALTA
jgi:DNA helicase-2/ATP-dependent DNA helicase PcrA